VDRKMQESGNCPIQEVGDTCIQIGSKISKKRMGGKGKRKGQTTDQ